MQTPEQEFAVINATETSKPDDDAHSDFTKPSKGALTTDSNNPSTVGCQLSAQRKSSSRRIAVHEFKFPLPNCCYEWMSIVTSAGLKLNFLPETCEAEVGESLQKRKRGRTPRLRFKRPNGLLEGASRCSTINHHHAEPSDALNPAIVNINEYQQEWPFIKRSPIWVTIESMELYQNLPQKPHFSLLKNINKDYREGLAIAHMTYGFDVGTVRVRLNKLLSTKAKVGEVKDKLKEIEKQLEKRNLEKSKIGEEVDQLAAEMQELQEKLVETVKKKNLKDEEIMMLQSNLHLVANQIMDWKVF
ncbi:hypothetical protein L6452_19769 [Arctium lappa]|uniref:Uncharacterized protein n=1 Tax=Arctium lappa TaxID=4217 RepID=A0ACB9BAE0_ARCLA|nr:hypothetical protein L6452_19769 [Arctium lappa]